MESNLTLRHYRVFLLPRRIVLLLGPGAEFPKHIDACQAVMVWAGTASDDLAALQAASF